MNIKANNTIIDLVNVDKIYLTDHHQTAGIKNVSISFNKAEMILILGPSGSGKTTLLTISAGLIKPTSGSVAIFNKTLENYKPAELQKLRAKKIGFVFQSFNLIESFTVEKNIELVLRFAGCSRIKSKEIAHQLLEQFGIDHLHYKLPSTLSQGEKQRVAIARAMANNADLIIADEPTSSLESIQGIEIIKLLGDYANKDGKCVVVASHDLRLKEYANRVVYLEDGIIKRSNNAI